MYYATGSMFSFLKPVLIFTLIEVIVLASFMTMWQGLYDKTLKVVKINNKDISLYSTELYHNYVFPIWTTSEENTYSNYGKNYSRNEIPSFSNVILTVDEYEVYYKGIRINNNLGAVTGSKTSDYKKVSKSKMRLKILRKNKVVYNGEFIEDITKYVLSKGRYFLHIYIDRNDNFYSIVKTHISFNIVVGGGNNEE